MEWSYEATLIQLRTRMSDRKLEQEQERSNVDAHKCRLAKLLQRITNTPSAFDEEDKRCVQAQIGANEARSINLEKEIRNSELRHREREELFRYMSSAILERTRILEEDDVCLSSHPDMLQFFARKQVSLQALLEAKVRETCRQEEAGQPHEHRFELGSQP